MYNIRADTDLGFGKTATHNYKLLNHLNELKSLNVPLLIGVSRKSMIYKTLGITVQDALNYIEENQ